MLHVFPAQGFEPQSPASKADVLPLDDAGMRCGGKESNLLPRQRGLAPCRLGKALLKREEGIEPSPSVWRTDALPLSYARSWME
jgi:hypothetical protein